MALAEQRLERFRAYGTTTIEAKTGYGLNQETESRCLHILNRFNTMPLGQPLIPYVSGRAHRAARIPGAA